MTTLTNLNTLTQYLCSLERGVHQVNAAQVKDVEAALGDTLRALSAEDALAVMAAIVARAGKRVAVMAAIVARAEKRAR